MMTFLNNFLNSIRGNSMPVVVKKETVIALAGNPNVGKSTVFNRLTGLRQHTGNWAGKTVSTAEGFFEYGGERFRVVDIPGMYSYTPDSPEEAAAAGFLLSGSADAVVAVCDAGCLGRGISFALETAELTGNIIICVNLTDEAERRGIHIDARRLSKMLGMPVVPTSAAHGRGMSELARCIAENGGGNAGKSRKCFTVKYPAPVEEKIVIIESAIQSVRNTGSKDSGIMNPRYLAIHLLLECCGTNIREFPGLNELSPAKLTGLITIAQKCREELLKIGLDRDKTAAAIVSRRILTADAICEQCVSKNKDNSRSHRDLKLDRFFTGKISGRICMLLLLCVVFWLTITGANYPSEWLAGVFGGFESSLAAWLEVVNVPPLIRKMLVEGVYRVLTEIISVMLPPMAIFFPLFTLLEDSGYLPRAAFNLDSSLARCGACGKQALTSCMGLGCNAVGVTGCRIIDSPRERIIAIITNAFIPCNGRFPMLTALISMFFLGSAASPFDSVLGALLLTGLICLGLLASLSVSKLLSLTLLRGQPSSFALELPPYRKPRVGSVIVRSALDRTLFVLGRAAAVAVPAGALIWAAANISFGGGTVLSEICGFLDPLGKFLGMDGVILTAFLLGLPANETVIPLMIMTYTAQGSITGNSDLAAIHSLLTANGWNAGTALCVMLFTLMHSPCATTCVTVYKETKSLQWTALSIIIPTVTGCAVCSAAAALMRFFRIM